MKKLCFAVVVSLAFLTGCINSSSGDNVNIEGRWKGSLSSGGIEQPIEFYIESEDFNPVIYLGGADSTIKGTGGVSGGVVSFTWPQGIKRDEFYNITGDHPDAQLTAVIEETGNFLEGTIYMGNPLEAKSFTATKVNTGSARSAVSARADSDKYVSTCDSPYAKVHADAPNKPDASEPSTVVFDGITCDVVGNSDAGTDTLENVKILIHPVDTSVLYPGALIDGGVFLNTKEMVLMDTGRAGGVLRLDDVNIKEGTDGSIETDGPVTYFNVEDAVSQLLPNIESSTSIFTAKAYETDSSGSFALEMGAGFSADQIQASGSFSFDWSTSSNFATYYGTQVYYTVYYETPNDPETGAFDRKLFFSPDTDTCSVLTNQDAPPVYVSSVSYGRMFFALAQGSHSSLEIQEAMDVAATTPDAGATISTGMKVSDILNSTSITYSVYGGSGSATANSLAAANGNDMALAWYNLIQDQSSAEFAMDNPGTPIFYTMKNAVDHSLVQMPYAVSFDSRNCYETPAQPTTYYEYKVHVSHIDDDVYLCTDTKEIHKADRKHQTSATWVDINDYIGNKDTPLNFTVGNYGCGATSAYMYLYRRSTAPGSSWHRIWHRKFKSDHPWTCGWQYHKTIPVNKDGSYNKYQDPKYEGDIWDEGSDLPYYDYSS